MIRSRFRWLALVAALVASMSACSQKASMALSMQATAPGGGTPKAIGACSSRALASPLSIPVKGKDGSQLGTLSITVAKVAVKNIQIEMEVSQVNSAEEEEQELEIEFTGPFLVDLVESTVNPAFPTIPLLPGVYDEIELSIARLEGTERGGDGLPLAPAGNPMHKRSLYVQGTYDGLIKGTACVQVPFVLAYDMEETFELSGADPALPMVLESGSLMPVIVAFRMVQWFDFSKQKTNPGLAIDFNSLTVSGQGIVLDETAADDFSIIRKVIKDNIKESADFGIDLDGDGILSPAEDDDEVDADDL